MFLFLHLFFPTQNKSICMWEVKCFGEFVSVQSVMCSPWPNAGTIWKLNAHLTSFPTQRWSKYDGKCPAAHRCTTPVLSNTVRKIQIPPRTKSNPLLNFYLLRLIKLSDISCSNYKPEHFFCMQQYFSWEVYSHFSSCSLILDPVRPLICYEEMGPMHLHYLSVLGTTCGLTWQHTPLQIMREPKAADTGKL